MPLVRGEARYQIDGRTQSWGNMFHRKVHLITSFTLKYNMKQSRIQIRCRQQHYAIQGVSTIYTTTFLMRFHHFPELTALPMTRCFEGGEQMSALYRI